MYRTQQNKLPLIKLNMENKETKANEPIQIFGTNSTDPNAPCFLKSALHLINNPIDPPNNGLAKREYFAAIAMQGIIANKDGLDIKIERIVESAIDIADSLIDELNKTK